MGKIFDALEKAGKPTRHLKKSLASEKTSKAKKPDDGVIVPFANLRGVSSNESLDRNLIAYHSPQTVEAELFKVLRTNLLYPSTGSALRSIMVTSPTPGDGKSFISANLAITIAQGVEDHVLLVDSDLRRPSINNYFGIKQQEGLSDYLTTNSDVSKILVKTPIEKLTILPAGTPPDNPSELLTAQKMKALLKEVRKRYADRFIIVDSAPPSVASETVALANFVDGVIIVVKAGKTKRSAVTQTIEQLGKKKIVGIVLNYSGQTAKRYYGYNYSYDKPSINNLFKKR